MEKLETADRALGTLEDILDEPLTTIVRDATIQRFEYSFEACWKALKEYLSEEEGVICNSPKSCFRAAFRVGLLNEEQIGHALAMTDARNTTSHTYIEALAKSVYERSAGFSALMRTTLTLIHARLTQPDQKDAEDGA